MAKARRAAAPAYGGARGQIHGSVGRLRGELTGSRGRPALPGSVPDSPQGTRTRPSGSPAPRRPGGEAVSGLGVSAWCLRAILYPHADVGKRTLRADAEPLCGWRRFAPRRRTAWLLPYHAPVRRAPRARLPHAHEDLRRQPRRPASATGWSSTPTGKTLGRLATQIADALRGKRKPEYTPHVDTGDFVVVVNAEKISVTGNKRAEKKYYRHSGYPGGLKTRTLEEMLERRPEEVIRLAVKGMLPRNRLARKQLTKLKVYAGPDHPHAAQQPHADGDRVLMADDRPDARRREQPPRPASPTPTAPEPQAAEETPAAERRRAASERDADEPAADAERAAPAEARRRRSPPQRRRGARGRGGRRSRPHEAPTAEDDEEEPTRRASSRRSPAPTSRSTSSREGEDRSSAEDEEGDEDGSRAPRTAEEIADQPIAAGDDRPRRRRALPRDRQAQDRRRARDPQARHRRLHHQRPHARRLLPARRRCSATIRQPLETVGYEDAHGRRRPHARRRRLRPGRRAAPRHLARAARGRPEPARRAQAPRLPDARRARQGAQEGRPQEGPQAAAVLASASALRRHGRRLFGTDGVRGVAGEVLTAELALALGRAATRCRPRRERPRVLVIRDTRESGEMLEAALAAGVAAAGGEALLGGVLPTPGRAAAASRRYGFDLGVVISASHNPYARQRDQVLRRRRLQAVRRRPRREIEARARRAAPPAPRAASAACGACTARSRTTCARCTSASRDLDLSGRRRRCSTAPTARPTAPRRRSSAASAPTVTVARATSPTGATSTPAAARPTSTRWPRRVARRRPRRRLRLRRRRRPRARRRPHGRGRRRRRADRARRAAPARGRAACAGDGVAVTVMTNYGFHTAMREAGDRGRDDRRRRPLRARGAARARLGAGRRAVRPHHRHGLRRRPATASPPRC